MTLGIAALVVGSLAILLIGAALIYRDRGGGTGREIGIALATGATMGLLFGLSAFWIDAESQERADRLENLRFVRSAAGPTSNETCQPDVPASSPSPFLPFSGLNLSGASLRGMNLNGADFTDADLRDVDFSGSDLNGARFDGANLEGAKFGVIWIPGVTDPPDPADLTTTWHGKRVNACNSRFVGTNLQGADLRGAEFSGSMMLCANLSGSQFGEQIDISTTREVTTTFVDVTYNDGTSWPHGAVPPHAREVETSCEYMLGGEE